MARTLCCVSIGFFFIINLWRFYFFYYFFYYIGNMKQCNKCNKVKPIEKFVKVKHCKSGYGGHCSECENERTRVSYQKHKERKLAQNKKWSKANKDHHRKLQYKWRDDNIDKVKASTERRKEKRNATARKRMSWRRKYDNLFILKNRVRSSTANRITSQGYKKNTKTYKILCCSWGVLKQHLASQFTEGMSWDNQGDWHIDHIIPLASANTEEELVKLCHYKNLQPLWAEDNMRKSDTMPPLCVQYKVHKAIKYDTHRTKSKVR